MSEVGVLKTPENMLLLAALKLAYPDPDAPPPSKEERDRLLVELQEAAIDYGRYFVAEECAKIADPYDKQVAAAIRKHGGVHPSKLDFSYPKGSVE